MTGRSAGVADGGGPLFLRQALVGGFGGGRLPPHMVFSDRDFNESDYEALLALDETIENRKGAPRQLRPRGGRLALACSCAVARLEQALDFQGPLPRGARGLALGLRAHP